MTDHRPTLAYDLDRDLHVLTAMASSLTPYLYEDEVYGQLGGNLPKLTLGGLLMRLYRLSHLDNVLDAPQQDTVRDARLNFEAEKAEWSAHYEQKLLRELQSRIEALDYFVRECVEDAAMCVTSYPSQAEKRIMIEHLAAEAKDTNVLTEDLAARLAELDQRLRRVLVNSDFIIADDRLKAVYPRERFWWLYAHISER
jgi:hypothetical protein